MAVANTEISVSFGMWRDGYRINEEIIVEDRFNVSNLVWMIKEIIVRVDIIGIIVDIIVGVKVGIIGTIINRGIVIKISKEEINNHNNYVAIGKNSQIANIETNAISGISFIVHAG